MFARRNRQPILWVATCLSLALATPLAAQESADADASGLDLELNRSVETDQGCRLGFVTQNNLGEDLSKAAFEVVLFNSDDLIDRLLVLDFGAMADGRTKVREFNLPDTDCSDLNRILVNDAAACEGEGVEPSLCISSLNVTSKTDIAFGL